jgi:WASH complex subunit FAM21
LEEFSQKLITKTKDLETLVDSLVFEIKATDVKVHNTFNEFLMLSNTQFIENVRDY